MLCKSRELQQSSITRLHKSNSLADNNHRTEPINLFKKTWIISLTHLSSTKASLPWFKSLFLVCFGLNEKKIILVRHIGTYWNIVFMLFPWWWSDKLVTNPLAFAQKTVTKKYRRIPQSSLNSSRWRVVGENNSKQSDEIFRLTAVLRSPCFIRGVSRACGMYGESVSRYRRPLRLCMRNKILRSANAKYHYILPFFL